jgi:hypothetical protein
MSTKTLVVGQEVKVRSGVYLLSRHPLKVVKVTPSGWKYRLRVAARYSGLITRAFRVMERALLRMALGS